MDGWDFLPVPVAPVYHNDVISGLHSDCAVARGFNVGSTFLINQINLKFKTKRGVTTGRIEYTVFVFFQDLVFFHGDGGMQYLAAAP